MHRNGILSSGVCDPDDRVPCKLFVRDGNSPPEEESPLGKIWRLGCNDYGEKKKMKLSGQYIQVDKDLLKKDIVKRYPLSQMSNILGLSDGYLTQALNQARSYKGFLLGNLEKICLIINEEPSKYILTEEAGEPNQEAQETNAPDMTKLYEGVELNGQALGKLIEAVKEQTDAIKEQTEEIKKLATDMTNWSKKWCNQQKYGRF